MGGLSGQRLPSEDEEWLAERARAWVDTYKKSMLTPVLLAQVGRAAPVTIAELAHAITETTGWDLTERGLYRTVKRLEDARLLSSVEVDAARTGAKRKELSLTADGAALLRAITAHLVALP